MGQLVNGKWDNINIDISDKNGRFERAPSQFRDIIASDHSIYQPESDRYHLYVSYACPWATRALILRSLKGLEKHIDISIVHPDLLEMGWSFNTSFDDTTGDKLYGLQYLHQLYQKSLQNVTTKATVPVLWDKKTETIVNNESSEIIRILNTAFNEITGNWDNYYPQFLQSAIDNWNDKIYRRVNNGVYRCGFAKTQGAYDEAAIDLFNALDTLDTYFAQNDYLVGNQMTEADIRLIPTLLRFDIVYYVHFKTNLRKISEYKHLYQYMQRLYKIEAIKKNHNFKHIKRHYYYSHVQLNPQRIVPIGPAEYL